MTDVSNPSNRLPEGTMATKMRILKLQYTPWIVGALAFAALTQQAIGQFGSLKKGLEKVQKVQEATKPMTVEEEREIGREVAAKIIAYFHVYRNDALTRYVNEVG